MVDGVQDWGAKGENASRPKLLKKAGVYDIRTTMIYTHCIQSKTANDAKKPMDSELAQQ
jgi:hypothetical protein